jgi:hypothetical protein
MTHNHNTRAKALVSGGCVISGEINFDYRTFFLNNGLLSHLDVSEWGSVDRMALDGTTRSKVLQIFGTRLKGSFFTRSNG